MECAIPPCDRKAEKRGWCGPHYKRWLRHGNPLAGGAPRQRGRVCKVESCNRPTAGRGWCVKHYARWQSGSDPVLPKWTDLTVEQRFWVKVDKAGPLPERRPELGPCWQWIAGKTGAGYGAFGSHAELAHRISYMALVGPIPSGTELDHLCRNRGCVRPAHLEAVPHRVNAWRGDAPHGVNKRKTHCVHGHEFTPENTYVSKVGARTCRECSRRRVRERRARLKD